ncbi:hypothetical protein CRUP_009297, partial [Coryphaenoides rupestris]
HSPPAGSPERPPGGVSPLPLRPQSCCSSSSSSPSRAPHHGQSPGARPLSMVCSTSPGPSPLSSPAARHPLLPLSCLAPPNASAAALLNGSGEAAGLSPTPPAGPSSPGAAAGPKPEKKEKKAGGLLKLLSGAAAKKKSRSTPSSPPAHEARTPSSSGHGHHHLLHLHHHHHHHHASSGHCSLESLGRAGSCPIESELGGAVGLEPLHRKSGSLDASFPMSPPARPGSALLALRPETKPLSRESEAEIELREGDVVFVHKRRDDGWFKGTLQRTGRTGLFPGSFLESF